MVTTIPTQITTTSGRCNAVAIISNGVGTNGYFEYGLTQNLGYSTNSAYIGNQPSSPFSNVLSGLTPNTTYYCRAVITNTNGTYKGEIMSFRTDANYTPYIPYVPAPVVHNPKPVKVTKIVKGKTITKYVAPKTEKGGVETITCKDIEGNTGIIKAGEKLITLDMTKSQGELSPNSTVEYTVKYSNTSRLTLANVKLKVTLPAELSIQNGNLGTFDAGTNTITINLGNVQALSDSQVKILAKVNANAEVGRTVIVNGYVSYEILDSKGKVMRDENTAYLVSTIIAKTDSATANTKDNNSKSDTIKSANNILPSTLLEWLAIIVLITVLIVLGRVIYSNLKGEKTAAHH